MSIKEGAIRRKQLADRKAAIRNLVPIPEVERHQFNITDLKVGGYFSFHNQDWLVTDISRYLDVKWSTFARRKKDEWTTEITMFSLNSGETRCIEYSVDDDVEICFTEKEVKLRELGVTRDDLEEFAEEEEGTITFNGKTFDYSDDESWAALYFRGDDKEGVPVRFYEFEADDGACLTVELWYDDTTDERPDREAYVSGEVNSAQVTILQLSA